MSLPQIQEMDPWLEEDEEMYMMRRASFDKSNQNTSKPNENRFSLTGSVTNLAKVSVYIYIISRILIRTPIFANLLKIASKYLVHFKNFSTGSIILVLLTFLKFHKRFSQSNYL